MSKLKNERLARYVEAEKAVLMGQSYTIGNRTMTRADLSSIRVAIDNLIASGATLDDSETPGKGRGKRIVFFD